MRDFEQESTHREITDENIEDELKAIDNVSLHCIIYLHCKLFSLIHLSFCFYFCLQ
jgi:hypothetical protein